jgi:hypothetical protein
MEVAAPYRFSVHDVTTMEEAGILSRNIRIELLDGQINITSPIGLAHTICVRKLNQWLHQILSLDQFIVDIQNTIQLDEYSLLQPDVVIARMRKELLEKSHIQPTDVVLLIEVSDSTLRYDQDQKLPLYAQHGISECWIVNLNDQQVEVYEQPEGNQFLKKHFYQSSFHSDALAIDVPLEANFPTP